jgi:hypothetical protein
VATQRLLATACGDLSAAGLVLDRRSNPDDPAEVLTFQRTKV